MPVLLLHCLSHCVCGAVYSYRYCGATLCRAVTHIIISLLSGVISACVVHFLQIANMVVYLSSDASNILCGQTILMEGGFTIC
jgi:hypothetical protein